MPSPAPAPTATATTALPATAIPAPASPTATPNRVPTPPAVAPAPATPSLGQAAEVWTAVTVAQATSEAVIPTLTTAVGDIVQRDETQALLRQVAALLGGVSLVQVEQSPAGALPVDTTRLVLRGTDTAGTLARLQPLARQLAAGAALATAGQVFPNAAIELDVQDGSGKVILRGTREPGQQPQVTVSD